MKLNLLRDGYEACADGVARHIKAGRTDYAVHVKPSGAVMVTPSGGSRAADRPAAWFVGNYAFDGLRTEHIEDDMIERERELRALEAVLARPAGKRHFVGRARLGAAA